MVGSSFQAAPQSPNSSGPRRNAGTAAILRPLVVLIGSSVSVPANRIPFTVR